MPELDSKLPDVETTIFTVMSQLANECGAINLSQGFPSFDPPEALTDRIAWHLKHDGNQYAPMSGIPELRRRTRQDPQFRLVRIRYHQLVREYESAADLDAQDPPVVASVPLAD